FILTQACKEFEQRAGQLKSPRGEKTALIEEAIARQAGLFSLSDLQSACPAVSVDLIRSVLKRLKGASIECLGRGHTAKWRKTAK
ncbi:MAG: Fic family protein, partial [Verrucomicrobiota bacterium]